MDSTRRGFMGLLAAFGIAPALPVLADAYAAPLPAPLADRPMSLGMWVRRDGGAWRRIGSVQTLEVVPHQLTFESMGRRIVQERSLTIDCSLSDGELWHELTEDAPLDVRYLMQTDGRTIELTAPGARIIRQSLSIAEEWASVDLTVVADQGKAILSYDPA